MKKLILIAMILLIPTMAMSADVTLSVTIPSDHVAKMAQAVTTCMNCEATITTPTETPLLDEEGQPTGEMEMVDVTTTTTLGPKACMLRQFRNELKELAIRYNRLLAEQAGTQSYNDAYKAQIDSFVPLTVDSE